VMFFLFQPPDPSWCIPAPANAVRREGPRPSALRWVKIGVVGCASDPSHSHAEYSTKQLRLTNQPRSSNIIGPVRTKRLTPGAQ